MKYITRCPGCGKNLRFPLDKGKIKIRCTCGYEMFVDPDDTSLYKNGRFDIKPGKTGKERKPVKKTGSLFDKDKIIRELYDIKYSIQNFKHLPDREKYRIMILVLLPLLLLILILYAFFGLLI